MSPLASIWVKPSISMACELIATGVVTCSVGRPVGLPGSSVRRPGRSLAPALSAKGKRSVTSWRRVGRAAGGLAEEEAFYGGAAFVDERKFTFKVGGA